MRHVKWIFVVLLISSLTSFVEKDKPTGGLNVGDVAPDFTIESTSDVQHNFDLTDLKGKYVLLSFWASYDAQSRMQNASLSNALRSTSQDVEMVSVSFDEYQSVFQETIRKDQIVTPTCFVETEGEDSGLFKKYRLNRGFTNYLLDGNGVIIAKNISAAELSAYANKIKG
jgi:peroxiredoxin